MVAVAMLVACSTESTVTDATADVVLVDLPDVSELDVQVPDDVPGDSADAPDQVDAPDVSACPGSGQGVTIGVVAPSDLSEISGVVPSRAQPGVLWVHNDSGGDASIHALSELGDELVRYRLQGAVAEDWEDIALGPYPGAQGDFLYVGDIGDNPRTRKELGVYVLAEPATSEADDKVVDQPIDHHLRMAYPDEAHDAETLMIDPISGALYVLTKEWDGLSKLFRYAPPFDPDERANLQLAATIDHADLINPIGNLSTGGDIAPDGSLIAIRTYNTAWAWRRVPGQTIGQAVTTERCALETLDERQGEALGFTSDGGAYVTISEDPNPRIYRFQLLPASR